MPAEEHMHEAPIAHVVVQSSQTPLVPQAVGCMPATQLPPVEAEQQPPLHGSVEEQALPQCEALQAAPAGQSVAIEQPHTPPAAPGRHWAPAGDMPQGLHAIPPVPHAVGSLPDAQEPAWQQPPWHGWSGLHAVVHS
jgi:hypothetical protein